MHKPELHSLSIVNWQLFCTLTFKSENVPDRVRNTMFFSLIRKQACNFGVHFKEVLWCLRSETGESTGRLHFHALIAGLPTHVIHERTCFATMKIWESLGGGHARVSKFSPMLDGVDYILKGLEALNHRKAGDLYEFQKFGTAAALTLSESTLRVIEGRRFYRKDGVATRSVAYVGDGADRRRIAPVGVSA